MSHHNSTNPPPFSCIMANWTHGHVTVIQKYKGKAPFGCVKQALNLLFFVTAKTCRSPENKEENLGLCPWSLRGQSPIVERAPASYFHYDIKRWQSSLSTQE